MEQADALAALPRHQGDIAFIAAFDVVEHLTKQEAVTFFKHCYRALGPGGALVVQTPNAASPWGAGVRYGDFSHEIGLTPTSLGHLFRLAGFETLEFREAGPVAHGVVSTLRFMIWQVIRLLLVAWDYVETGAPGSSVKTRVMLARGVKS